MTRPKTLEDLFVDEVLELYDAEKQLSEALPRFAGAAASDAVRHAIEEHLAGIAGHLERLERVCEILEQPPCGTHCSGIAGIIEDSDERIRDSADALTMDAGILAGAQRAEHYKIGAYGTLVTWANHLGQADIATLLSESLLEEKAAGQKLTLLAEGGLNVQAMCDGVPVLRQ